MTRIPEKLKSDSIVDAIFEIRFDCKELHEAPELVVGFLAANPLWRSYERKKLPAADIPEQIRLSDPNLQHQATLELISPDNGHRISLGLATVRTSRVGSNYPGWRTMISDIRTLAEHAFASLEALTVTRVGLRYINVLVPEQHLIGSVHDFRLNVTVDGEPLEGGINLNFQKKGKESVHTVRIASPEFIANMQPPNGVAVVDIDSTPLEPEALSNPDSIIDWAMGAHTEEKEIFFSLFEEEKLNEIVEQWQ